MSTTPTSPFANSGPGFNQHQAELVYGQIMKMDADSAIVYSRMLVGAALQNDLIVHDEEIAKAAHQLFVHRTAALRKQLIRTTISKARAGEDNTAELEALVQISKAGLFSPFFLSQKAQDQKRDPNTGQFQVMHERVHVPHDAEEIPGKYASRMDIPHVEGLQGEQKAAFQNGYLEVQRLVRPFTTMPNGRALATFHYGDDKPTYTELRGDKIPIVGDHTVKVKENGAEVEKPSWTGIDPRRRIQAVTVDVIPPQNAAGGIYAALNALGLPKFGSAAAGATTPGGALNVGTLDTFHENWTKSPANDQFMPSNKLFRRLDTGSELLAGTLGTTAPPQMRLALAVARHVGALGPRANKILAPTMDRAAYRYRGTERSVDAPLQRAVDDDKAAVAHHSGAAAKIREIAAEQQKEARAAYAKADRQHKQEQRRQAQQFELLRADVKSGRITAKEYGRKEKTLRGDLERSGAALAEARTALDAAGDQGRIAEERGTDIEQATLVGIMRRGKGGSNGTEWQPSETLRYFRTRIPTPELADLQLKSGVVPPSEGVIVGPDGSVKAQTVGYGDDHYLPFTLKNLAKLKGGYYIRTRTYGGPTTEDVYTALISGAKGLTVVSNNGVFTLDFDHDLKGGRRFNDKAARMVGRYGHLLDAVKSKTVQGADIDPTRMWELRRKAAQNAAGDPAGQIQLLEQYKADERHNPTLSDAQKQKVASDYLNQVVNDRDWNREGAHTRSVRTSNALPLQTIAELVANRQAATFAREHKLTGNAQTEMATHYLNQYTEDPTQVAQRVADALGARPGLERALADELAATRKRLLPLRLDGRGYDAALHALQEQFPYYLADVSYRPHREGATEAGVDGEDTGYVKPLHNRPSAALAGYFDSVFPGDGAGGSKVHADSIRFQNGRTSTRPANVAQAQTITQGVGDAAGAQQASAAPAAAAATQDPKAARNAADLAMLKHLHDLKDVELGEAFFDPSHKNTKITYFLGKKDPATRQPLIPDPGDEVLNTSLTEAMVNQRNDADAWHAKLQAVVDQLMSDGAYRDSWDPEVLDRFRGEGKAPALVPLTADNIMDALASPHRDWKFNEPIYAKGTKASPDDIIGAYNSDAIKALLISPGLLPETPEDGLEFKQAVDAYAKQLTGEAEALTRWKADGEPAPRPPITNERELHQRIFTLAQASQLGRRYQESVQAAHLAAEAAAPPPEAPAENRIIVMHMGEQEQQAKAIAGAPGLPLIDETKLPDYVKVLLKTGALKPEDVPELLRQQGESP